MTDKIVPKIPNNYECKLCDYISCKKYNWDKHVMTSKHKMEMIGSSQEMAKWQKVANYSCNICEKNFKNLRAEIIIFKCFHPVSFIKFKK